MFQNVRLRDAWILARAHAAQATLRSTKLPVIPEIRDSSCIRLKSTTIGGPDRKQSLDVHNCARMTVKMYLYEL